MTTKEKAAYLAHVKAQFIDLAYYAEIAARSPKATQAPAPAVDGLAIVMGMWVNGR